MIWVSKLSIFDLKKAYTVCAIVNLILLRLRTSVGRRINIIWLLLSFKVGLFGRIGLNTIDSILFMIIRQVHYCIIGYSILKAIIRTNVTTTDHRTAIDRRSAMTVYLGFNKTDGYYGWNSELSGYTVFYNWMEGIGTVLDYAAI